MNDYEKKLNAFRNQRKKQYFFKQCKSYLWARPVTYVSSLMPKISFENEELLDKKTDSETCERTDDFPVDEDFDLDTQEPFNWFKCITYMIVWMGMFSYSVYIEFGVIFLILSGFYMIWANTRTGPKRPNEMSAYSVFNPNCERIEGTLDAKQLESEICYGVMF